MKRRVLITGGASGLGLALAKGFIAAGDDVLVGDLAQDRPEGIPEAAAYMRLDVRSQQDWDAALLQVKEQWAGLDILVNNAGIATGGRIDVEALADWERVLDINLLGVVRGCQTFTPLFKNQRSGHLVNIASLAGLVHGPGMSSYNAAKAGVVALSETLSSELSPWGITTSVVCPAFFQTNLHASFQGKDEDMHKAGERLITKAKNNADDVAATVLKGIDAKRYLILTDTMGRQLFWAKRLMRPIYDRGTKRAAQGLARRTSGRASDPESSSELTS